MMKEPMMPLGKDTLPYGDKNRSPFLAEDQTKIPETLRGAGEKPDKRRVAEGTERVLAITDAYEKGNITEDQMIDSLEKMGFRGIKSANQLKFSKEFRLAEKEIETNEILGESLKEIAREIAFYQILQERGLSGIDDIRDGIVSDLANSKSVQASLRSLMAAGVDMESGFITRLIENLISDLMVNDKNATMVAAAVRRAYDGIKKAA